ncbi:thioesterase II family protein [Streptomyces hirsutus]|uniref:thioesterase II family protein n=1 Tax=Streptomyces hirsutus TaxID=35620 RepID=UPI000A977956|nr:alpha/beta fold hydrolase [Streptomyces hirsutus]
MTEGPLMEWDPPHTATALLVCLPHAGSGAFQFRPWQQMLGPDIALVAVQLPGRENRWREDPATCMAEVLDELTPRLAARLDLPYYVFGHSMGALVGYELARRLGRQQGRWPRGFLASACRAPDEQGEPSGIEGLTDEQLVAELVADGVVPAAVGANSRLAAAVTRPLRGDSAICDTYTPPETDPLLRCPLGAWRGQDDEGVTDGHIRRWAEWSTGPATVRTFPGNHFYHLDVPRRVTAELRKFVTALLPTHH